MNEQDEQEQSPAEADEQVGTYYDSVRVGRLKAQARATGAKLVIDGDVLPDRAELVTVRVVLITDEADGSQVLYVGKQPPKAVRP